MPGPRAPPARLSRSVYVLDIIFVAALLLISHVHPDEARPPNELNANNARWQDSMRRSDITAPPTASNSPSLILPTGKTHNLANNDADGPIFSSNNSDPGDASGDGSLEEADTDDDNEEGDEDDYDDEAANDTMDPGSGSHESKDVVQPPTTVISSPPNRFSSHSGQQPSRTPNRPMHNLPNQPATVAPTTAPNTTIAQIQTTAAPAAITTTTSTTTTLAPPALSPISTTIAPRPPIREEPQFTALRPTPSSVPKLPNSSVFDGGDNGQVFGNSSYDYEDEDEEDEDDNDDSTNFEDNIPVEGEDHPNVSSTGSGSRNEKIPTLETVPTHTTQVTLNNVTTPMTDITTQLITTTAITPSTVSSTTTTTTLTRLDHNEVPTTLAPNEDDEDKDSEKSSDPKDDDDIDNDNNDSEDEDDDQDEDEDDVDELEDIDSDISELATTTTTATSEELDKQSTKYPYNLYSKHETTPAPPTTTTTTMITTTATSPSTTTTTTTTITTITAKIPTTFRPLHHKTDTTIPAQGPPVIMDSRIDEPITVQEIYPNLISGKRNFEFRSFAFLAQPILILLVLGVISTVLFVAILLVMFIIYKLRRQEENR